METFMPSTEPSTDKPFGKSRRDFIRKASLFAAGMVLMPESMLAGSENTEKSSKDRMRENVDFVERLRQGDAKISVELENDGDPRIGRIINVKQLHNRPEFSAEQKELVAEYQHSILTFLDRHNVDHVFVESLNEDFSAGTDMGKEMRDAVRFVFPGGIPAQFNETQKEMLTEYGAPMILAYVKDTVSLHKTYTPQESEAIDSEIRRLGYGDPQAVRRMTETREELAMREVGRFLNGSPGATVALVFGAAHSFGKYVAPADSPSLYSVSYPELIAKFSLQRSMQESRNSVSENMTAGTEKPGTEAQLQSIDGTQTGAITSFIYSTKSDPGLQLKAIRKA
jgi:hypothetical protein